MNLTLKNALVVCGSIVIIMVAYAAIQWCQAEKYQGFQRSLNATHHRLLKLEKQYPYYYDILKEMEVLEEKAKMQEGQIASLESRVEDMLIELWCVSDTTKNGTRPTRDECAPKGHL